MRITSIIFILLIYGFVSADQIEKNLIVENCVACHNLKYDATKKIPSLKSINKEEFINLMTKYKNGKDGSVMNRISKVLSNEDIKVIADIIY